MATEISPFHWTCPFCNRATTIVGTNAHIGSTNFTISNAEGSRRLNFVFIVCPNPECRRFTLSLNLNELKVVQGAGYQQGKQLMAWHLIPPSKAKPFPAYVPEAIVADYNEACLIADASPKASATLARRCLQGILRDFWRVKPGRLVDEIEQIKERIDPLTWDAIEAVRKVGNIGAHMEKDINLIIDVDPNEAVLLIELIETLLRDWYVARHEKEQRLKRIVAVATEKKPPKTGEPSA